MTSTSCLIAYCLLVIEYKLCRRRHNRYSMIKSQQAVREFTGATRDMSGNLPPVVVNL
jgi:hypothetical protein